MIMPEGVTHRRLESDHADGPPLEKLALGAQSLFTLSSDFVFFTLLPLWHYTRLDFDPVQAFVNSYKMSDTPNIASIEFNEPIFSSPRYERGGLNQLLGCETKYWDALRRHLASIVLIDRDRSEVIRTLVHSVRVGDQLERERRGVFTRPEANIDVVAFGVDSNHRLVAFHRDSSAASETPRLANRLPLAQTVAWARQTLEGQAQAS